MILIVVARGKSGSPQALPEERVQPESRELKEEHWEEPEEKESVEVEEDEWEEPEEGETVEEEEDWE